MRLANCSLTTLTTAAKCYNCLNSTEKMGLEVKFMTMALLAAGGTDLTNINTLRRAVACF